MSTSGASTPSASRGVSPIPQRYPSRVVSGEVGGRGGKKALPVGGLLVPPSNNEGGKGGGGSPVGILGGWGMGSWSAWQEIASSVLGGTQEVGEMLTGSGAKGKGKSTWGVESLPQVKNAGIGEGGTAEREATVRRRKMRRVLEGRDDEGEAVDTNGNYKHRTSTDEPRPGSSQDNEEAMVYIHHVQPNDTLAGVAVRYNCQPAVFRKANRFWPNDSIQVRKTVVLPIDACAIRGRPCEAPSSDGQGVDLLAPTPGIEEPPSLSNGTGIWPTGEPETSAARFPSNSGEEGENPWIHVRWVLIDSSPHSRPVEIARMPRKTLGYFPPRRRKSQSLTLSSTTSTPRASSEFDSGVRSPPQIRRTSALGQKPSVTSIPGSYFPPPAMTLPAPKPMNSKASGSLKWMTGPGGVGTLGKNVNAPGPGTDSMNSWVKKHLPLIAIDNLPSTSITEGERAHFGFNEEMPSISESGASSGVGVVSGSVNGSVNVGAGGGGGQAKGLGIENAAAAVEGWIRRLGTPGIGSGGGVSKGGGAREADLIELLDGAGSDDGRFEASPARGVKRGGKKSD